MDTVDDRKSEMDGSVVPTTEEYGYHYRLYLLVRSLGDTVLQKFLCSKIPKETLSDVLKKHKASINKNHHFSRKQKETLFPKHPSPKMETFDTTLLSLLLCYLPECGMNSQDICWRFTTLDQLDDSYTSDESNVVRIRILRNEVSHGKPYLSATDFQTYWEIAERAILAIGGSLINGLMDQIDDEKTRSLDDSLHLKSLLSNTMNFFKEHSGQHIVETSSLKKARTILKEHGMVVITGQPGEGKTTMAVSLALTEFERGRCLNLSACRDWREIDLEEKRIDAVIIDDIFGRSALKESLIEEWIPMLEEIERAVAEKQMSVVVTTREYIFKNMKDTEARQPIVGNERAIISLSSKYLSDEEKREMLRNHAQLKGHTTLTEDMINKCVKEFSYYKRDNVEGFHFGFPECVDMFFRNKDLFKKESSFFKQPNEFFMKCLHDLFKSESNEKLNFKTFVTVWANEGRITDEELDLTSNEDSGIVKTVLQKCGYQFEPSIKSRLRKTLKQHLGDFIVYSEEKQEYRFRHNVIEDMVGLVISKEIKNQTLNFCGHDFLFSFVTIDEAKPKDYCVFIGKHMYQHLAEACARLLRRSNSATENVDFSEHAISRNKSNKTVMKENINVTVLKHDAFKNKAFVKVFIDHIYKNDIINTQIMSLSGFLYNYGVYMKEEKNMCIFSYSIYIQAKAIFEEILSRNILNLTDIQFSLTLVVHFGFRDTVVRLLEAGVTPDGNALYIAIHRQDTDMLSTLLNAKEINVNDKGDIQDGNCPIIIASSKGFDIGVEMLIKKGADLSMQNDTGLTALDMAILAKKHTLCCKLLIDKEAPLDIGHGKFKRTPLHFAALKGLLEVVKILLKKGASVLERDNKKHCAVHLAAMKGNVDVVKELLTHDKSQASLRTYYKQTPSEHMTVFHIAVWKKNLSLLETLIELGINPNLPDYFGQSALLKAVQTKATTFAEKLLSYQETDLNF